MSDDIKVIEIENVQADQGELFATESAAPVTNQPVPDKITIVIDPVSKPLEAINGGIDLVVEGGKAIGKGFENMGKSMKKWFK